MDGKYAGQVEDDQRNGFGVYFWTNKKFYKGGWLNGKQEGMGVFENLTGYKY